MNLCRHQCLSPSLGALVSTQSLPTMLTLSCSPSPVSDASGACVRYGGEGLGERGILLATRLLSSTAESSSNSQFVELMNRNSRSNRRSNRHPDRIEFPGVSEHKPMNLLTMSGKCCEHREYADRSFGASIRLPLTRSILCAWISRSLLKSMERTTKPQRDNTRSDS